MENVRELESSAEMDPGLEVLEAQSGASDTGAADPRIIAAAAPRGWLS